MEEMNSVKRKRGISGSTLKLIALVTMLIDHIGAAVLYRMWAVRHAMPNEITWIGELSIEGLVRAYQITRSVGRVSFPIYCFLLVEGFQRTHNKWKYLKRLTLFALISEIPFDLAFSSTVLEFENQNVFFTLLWGLLAMIAADCLERKVWYAGNIRLNNLIQSGLTIASVGICAGACMAHAHGL